jgi:heterodisulfide reductase subunit C
MESIALMVKKVSGEDVNLCYQCDKCTSGCPVAYAMDFSPAQIIHACQLGMRDMVLNSSSIWLCAACETCNTRCPQGLDILKVMDALRTIARREKIKPKVPEILAFYETALRSLRLTGTIYEAGVGAVMKMRTGTLMKDRALMMEYIKKGRLGLFPKIRNVFRVNRIFKRVRKYEEF